VVELFKSQRALYTQISVGFNALAYLEKSPRARGNCVIECFYGIGYRREQHEAVINGAAVSSSKKRAPSFFSVTRNAARFSPLLCLSSVSVSRVRIAVGDRDEDGRSKSKEETKRERERDVGRKRKTR